MRRTEDRIHLDGPPTEVFEVGKAVGGCELEWCAVHHAAAPLVHPPLKSRAGEIEHPPRHLGAGERRRQRPDVAVFEIHQETLRQHEGFRGTGKLLVQERVAGSRIGEVDRMSPQPAARGLIGERSLLLGEQLRQIRLDPGEVCRQVQP